MRLFNTPLQAFLADLACWTALSVLLVFASLTVDNLIVSGLLMAVTGAVVSFAVFYNGRNVLVLLRHRNGRRLADEQQKAYFDEQRKRDEEDAAVRIRENERDGALGRAIIDTINRYS